ncbi:hypothetical protein [Actinomadura rupiterrae]|uniref:hypothetical protein n=1 Tax=Actinomadura rupiterrae TaxID=559627 RepID=UPI0020A510DA|nr:hypothetical protein [Actinomadura rupiterrae]MCP2338617.1 hypothetical protein [Actinomadura rupiterrae]
MDNLPADAPPPLGGEGTVARLRLFVGLMAELHALGRGVSLALAAHGQPVLYVRDGETALAVLSMRAVSGAWLFCWGGGHVAAADGAAHAAHQIAAGVR